MQPADRKTTSRAAPVTIIVPPVVCHDLDPHTGIPFMPHIAASLAGTLRAEGHRVQVLDSFGIDSVRTEVIDKEFLLIGLPVDVLVQRVRPDAAAAFIYCRTMSEFIAVEKLIRLLRQYRPAARIILFENIQAVVSYSLKETARPLLAQGVDCILQGEGEDRAGDLVRRLGGGASIADVPGISFLNDAGQLIQTPDAEFVQTLDDLPLPAWDLFDLDGYWSARFAHAPIRRGQRFLPLLTSRGCPFGCTFCIAPTLNPRWRPHSPRRVVDEIEHFHNTLGVTDFHISDLNPTVNEARTREICREILRRGLKISWKLAQGTKIETLTERQTLELMARSGCEYVSFSPETGSPRLLEIMNKPFDHAHALKMARIMHQLDIRMQAVFLVGVPGETAEDRRLSLAYSTKLLRAGVDEISAVIFTPLPGAKLAKAMKGFEHYSQCTPSPNWRSDYRHLCRHRMRMYRNLVRQQLLYHPQKLLREIFNVLTLSFQTKMEMSLHKQLKLWLLRYANIYRWIGSRRDRCG
jgi:anaerobic magnesium-protoporphyrin IX monomethyl ester cyclase